MQEYYFRCKQILKEILPTQGFTTEAENSLGLGSSIRFTKDDIQIMWLYDLRDQLLVLQMEKEKKVVERRYFYGVEKLQSDFLSKLEEMLRTLGLEIPEQNRRLAMDDIASFPTRKAKKTKKVQKGCLARFFGGKSSR